MTVAAILKHKGSEVARAAPTDMISDVVRQLSKHRIGAVPVCDATGHLLGILSERDVMYALAMHGPVALDMTAAQVMSTEITTATRATTVHEAMRAMTDIVWSGNAPTECVSVNDSTVSPVVFREVSNSG